LEPDYYKTLGVAPTATEDEIKAAYRELARTMHPDGNQDDPHAEEKFIAINEAAAVLRDPQKRADYDARRRPPEAPRKSPDPARTRPQAPERPAPPGPRRPNPMEKLFEPFLKGGSVDPLIPGVPQPPKSPPQQPAASAAIPIQVTLEEAYSGRKDRPVKVDVRGACPDCRGTGRTTKGQG